MLERPRRLRQSPVLRDMVRETELCINDFIYPVFVCEGSGKRQEIDSMPGIFRYSLDRLAEELDEARQLGIRGILLFGIPEEKDELGSGAYDDGGIVQRAVRFIKQNYDFLVITDVCLCEYTSHGHCGIVRNGEILNDETLPLLAKTALSHAKAGADIVAPSDMMDGRVRAIRECLDKNGYSSTAIMAYSAKYCSAYYGPFREAAGSAPKFGDRKTYQMDCGNSREALREITLDVGEGADLIMVKPALAYLDIVRLARENFQLPVVAYNVSGEYAMVKAAARLGYIDEAAVIRETLLSMKRAGADLIITYHAKEIAKLLNGNL